MNTQPSPETFIIECNRKIASDEYPNMNSTNHEYTNIINPPFRVLEGDEIKVSNTFINEIGASSDILIFNNNDNPDNKTRIVYSFHAMDDGINQKRSALDIAGRSGSGQVHEWKTFNPIELMRYQPFAYWVIPSDVTTEPYKTLFPNEIKKFIKGVGNQDIDKKIWFPDEDRYLPSRFFSYLEIAQTKVKNGTDKFTLQIDATNNILTIANQKTLNGGEPASSCLRNFIQKGMIVNIETERSQLVTANTAHLYLDGYYQVCDTKGWTDANPDWIKLYPLDSRYGGIHQAYNLNTYDGGTALAGQPKITFRPHPYFNDGVISAGVYVSTGIGNTIFDNATKVLSVGNSSVIHTVVNTANGYNTVGQSAIRIQDVTQVELHEHISAPANTYIPNDAIITSIIPDTSPNRKAIAKHSSIEGDTDIPVETNDGNNTASLVTTLFYNIEDDNDIAYNINTYADATNGSNSIDVDDYNRNSNKFFRIIKSPAGTLRIHGASRYVNGQELLLGSAGQYIDYSSHLNIGNISADPFTSASQDYDMPMGSLYEKGYTDWIELDDDAGYSLTTHNPKYMIATIGDVGVNQNLIQIVDYRLDPIFNNPQVKLHDPLPIPIGTVDDAGFGVINDDFNINGVHYAGQISTTEFNILVDDLYNMDGLTEGAYFISDVGNYLQFPANTRIVSIHHPQGQPDRLFRIVLDKPTTTGTKGGAYVFPCATSFSSNFNISNPDGADCGTIQYTGDLMPVSTYLKENDIISQTALTMPQIQGANVIYNQENLYSQTVIGNVIAGIPLDDRIVNIQDIQISVDGRDATYNTGVQRINLTDALTGNVPQGTTLQIAQKCIDDDTYITATEDNGWIKLSLSKPLLADFKSGRDMVKITKPYTNVGTIFMDTNLTAPIPFNTALTFTTTHAEVTLDKNLLQNCPPDTQVYFSAISINQAEISPVDLIIKPKGYSYEAEDSSDIMAGRDYGISWEDGGFVNDVMYQYQLITRANAGQVPNTNDNIETINGSTLPALTITANKAREGLAVGSYNSISTLGGKLNDNMTVDDNNITLNFENVSGADFNNLFTAGSTIFNSRRGLVIYIQNGEISTTPKLIRIPNGANDPHIQPYCTITKDVGNLRLTITGIKRGVCNTTPQAWTQNSTFFIYDENIFNEDFITEPNSACHEYSDSGVGNYLDYDESQGRCYFYSTMKPDEIANKCEGIIPAGIDGSTTMFNLNKTYIFTCSEYKTKKEWVKHYEYQDIDLGDNIHLSPSDVGSIVTDIFHKPANAKASMEGMNLMNIGSATSVNRIGGLDIPNSKGYVPHNRLYIPIWNTPVEEATNHKNGVGYYSWFGGSATSVARTEPLEYSFKFVVRYSNMTRTTATTIPYMDDNGVTVPIQNAGDLIEGDWDIHIRGSQLSIPNQLDAGLKSGNSYPIDIFNGTQTSGRSVLNPNAKISVLMGQFIGTNNLTMNYNVNTNRTELMFAHNPYTTPTSMANAVVEGGDIATFIPFPSVNGKDGMKPFHAPYLAKTGGINIENYSAEICSRGQYTPITAFNNYNRTTTTKEYDMLNPFYDDTLVNKTNMENSGILFWTKLGWTIDQILEERGSEYDSYTGFLNLKGSTQSQVDSADNQFFKEVPSTDQGDPSQAGTINGQNGYAYGSVGGYDMGIGGTPPTPASGDGKTAAKKGTQYYKAFNNSRTGYNLPSTSGTPLLYYDPTQNEDPDGVIITNPDYWLHTGYSVLSDGSSTLEASYLPEKTNVPYFLLFCPELSSNNNFYTTKNKGSIDPEAIAVVSKLNVSQDYYFAYQSPITFYAKSDFTLSKITTRILAPNKIAPKNLGDASSVIYAITRYSPPPMTMKPTLTQVQDNYITNMIQMEKMKDQMMNQSQHGSELSKVNQLIESISDSVLTPDDEQASILTGIVQQANQLGLFNMDRGQMRDFVVNHPLAVGFMNALGHVQNWGFNPRQPIANPQVENLGRTEEEIITGVPIPQQEVRPLGEVLDMPFEPNISQPNTPIVTHGTPDPNQITDAINRAVYNEAILRGEARPLTERLGQGQPREIGYITGQPTSLTPTAELGQRLRKGAGQVLPNEPQETTREMTMGGIGRRELNQHRIALANQIAHKHSQLTGANYPLQYIATSSITEAQPLRPRNLTEREAQEMGTLVEHREHEEARSAPPSYRTRETGSIAPTYESFTSGNPFYKHHSEHTASTIPPSFHSLAPIREDPEE